MSEKQNKEELKGDELQRYLFAYREAFAVERNKSSIYANLFTIIITCIGALFSLYFTTTNVLYLALIPYFLIVWAAFVFFNVAYLKLLRAHLRKLEEKIFLDLHEEQWFVKFERDISKKISSPLVWIVIIFVLAILVYSVYKTLSSPLFQQSAGNWYTGGLCVSLMIFLTVHVIVYGKTFIDYLKRQKKQGELEKGESGGGTGVKS